MAELLNCVFCNNSGDKLILFTEETLRKCRTILKLRKEHNLKYKDVVLPVELYESGYHRQCYRSFTGLMKKYYVKESSSVPEDFSPASSSRSPSNTQSIEPQTLISQPSSTAAALLPDPSTVLQPTVTCDLTEAAPSTSQDNSEQLENLDSTSEIDISVEDEAAVKSKDLCCIFCDQKTKKHKSKRLPLFSTEKENFLSKFQDANESATEFINKIKNYPHSKIYYHYICKGNFSYKVIRKKNTPKSHWHDLRDCHQGVFNEMCAFLTENVIEKGKIYFLTYLHRYYMDLIEESTPDNAEKMSGNFTPQNLELKIMKAFSKEINFFSIGNKKILAPKHIISIDDDLFKYLKDEDILNSAALLLRKSVLNIKIDKLPRKITVEQLKKGEGSAPRDLQDFFLTLLTAGSRKRKDNRKCIRQVNSICEDVVYSVHNGKIKTSKHIMLGMTLKSLTSSRKIIDIIHRYGHCISYQGIEELETEATYTSIQKSSLCPETIRKSGHLSTGVAYDNFDRFVETKSGKDTLHDTVGIIYQNLDSGTTSDSETLDSSSSNDITWDSTRRRRRTFEAFSLDTIPYPKKPRMMDNLQLSVHESENLSPVNLPLYNTIDAIWMLSHALRLPGVPMWVGFNCSKSDNNSLKQIVSYLTPINASPTDRSVVLETMRQSQRICQDVQQTSIQVTYDLAIAKVALQIQSTEKPAFDNLFIHLGPFHIMMAYFKAVGKIIIDCGLSNIMVQSNLLAAGSVNGFLEGKHFNRCKRLHPLMGLGLQVLHFKSFLEFKNIAVTDDMLQEITRLQTAPISSFKIENEELEELLDDYNIYKQQTLNGEFGKTPQFYMMYINLVHYYLSLSRSIRSGDFELFKYVLPKMTNLFFICNQQNYARWTMKYYSNLLNVNETHPDLFEQFQQGSFGIQRTNKPFSKQPIDLVLEQTINADAARRLTGILFSKKIFLFITNFKFNSITYYLLSYV